MNIVCAVCGHRYPTLRGERLAAAIQRHMATHKKEDARAS